MCLRALAGLEKTLGPDHLTTLETINHLGTLSVRLENFERTEAFYLRSLSGQQKVQGLDHASTLATFHNLGVLYAHQNKFEEAEAIFLRALEGQEETFSPDHLSTLMTIYKLGLLYAEHNRLEEAEILYLRALSGAEKIVTPNHISSLALRTIVCLSNLYRQQDRIDKVEAICEHLQGRKINLAEIMTMRSVHLICWEISTRSRIGLRRLRQCMSGEDFCNASYQAICAPLLDFSALHVWLTSITPQIPHHSHTPISNKNSAQSITRISGRGIRPVRMYRAPSPMEYGWLAVLLAGYSQARIIRFTG